MRTNSLLPDPRDEADIERLEYLLSELRSRVSCIAYGLRHGEPPAQAVISLEKAVFASDPSRKET